VLPLSLSWKPANTVNPYNKGQAVADSIYLLQTNLTGPVKCTMSQNFILYLASFKVDMGKTIDNRVKFQLEVGM
jgi:hypothetical protein